MFVKASTPSEEQAPESPEQQKEVKGNSLFAACQFRTGKKYRQNGKEARVREQELAWKNTQVSADDRTENGNNENEVVSEKESTSMLKQSGSKRKYDDKNDVTAPLVERIKKKKVSTGDKVSEKTKKKKRKVEKKRKKTTKNELTDQDNASDNTQPELEKEKTTKKKANKTSSNLKPDPETVEEVNTTAQTKLTKKRSKDKNVSMAKRKHKHKHKSMMIKKKNKKRRMDR